MAHSRSQTQGVLGRLVDGMIRRSVRKGFHSVWWRPPSGPLPEPCIFVPNHHGWYDGYLMYLAATKLGVVTLDWIQEFDAFPLFRFVGGMPFPSGDANRRASTIRATIREMRDRKTHLLLFAEGRLHRPPEILEFGRSLDLVCRRVPEARIVPVAIRYEMAKHERPEAFLTFGEPMEAGAKPEEARLRVKGLLDLCAKQIAFEPTWFELLAGGTPDVNERWDMRNAPWNPRPNRNS